MPATHGHGSQPGEGIQPTLVVLPPAVLPGRPDPDWPDRSWFAAALREQGARVLVIPDAPPPEPGLNLPTATAHWVAHNAVAITLAQPAQPLILIVRGSAGALLPALGFAQRASRRRVGGYVIIDGPLPRPRAAADWPDAPVTFVSTSLASVEIRRSEHEARLRGWLVLPGADPVHATLRARH